MAFYFFYQIKAASGFSSKQRDIDGTIYSPLHTVNIIEFMDLYWALLTVIPLNKIQSHKLTQLATFF